MILQILDRQFNTLATVDNSLAGAIHFFNDEFHRYMADAVSTFNFSVLRNQPDIEHLVEGNYIQFTYNSRDYLMTIRRIEEDEWQLDIETEDLSLDLINETTGEYAASKAMKITEYLKIFLGNDTDVVLGLNEVYSYTRTLEWTGESTVLERIKSLANYFDAEIEFVTELNDDRSLKQLTLNIYHKYDDTHQGVGTDRSDIELRFGENVSTVKRTTDIRELYTAIKPVGSEGVNIKTIEETIKDDNGNVLYYTPKGSEYIYAPLANDRFGRQKAAEGAGYILMVYSYDTESVATLYGNALAQLKKYSEPAVTYEVEGFYDLDIGDVVSIADNKYTPTLLLEARVSEMVISFTQPESNKTIFSNYRVFESQVDSDLLKLMDDLKSDVDYAMQVAKTPIFKISTLGSTVFKNGEGEVELSAVVERANTDVTSEYSVFNWVKEFKLGGIDEEWTAAHKNFGKSITITPADFDDAAVFYYEAEGADGTLHTGGSASLVKVYDGEDGQTPVKGVDYFDGEDGTDGTSAYLHVRYSQNADGNPMTTDPTDAKYLGLQASQNPNASTVPADYDWSLVKGPQGIPGEAVDGKTSYLHIKYSDDGGKTFTGNTGEDTGAYLGQYVDFEPADSTDVSKYAWSKIKGDTGDDGQTPVVHPAWSWSPDGTDRFTTVYPTENILLNTSNVTKLDHWKSTIALSKHPFYKNGTENMFRIDNPNPAENYIYTDWYPASPGEWTFSFKGFQNSALSSFDVYVFWRKEDPSQTGFIRALSLEHFTVSGLTTKESLLTLPEGTKDVYIRIDNNGSKIADTTAELWFIEPVLRKGNAVGAPYTSAPSDDYANAYPLYEGTYSDYSETASTNPTDYTWRRIIGESGQDGNNGADGVGIASTAVTYQASSNGTTAPTGTWSTTIPSVAANQYLWTRTVISYTNNTSSTAYSVGKMGANGATGPAGTPGKDGSNGANGVSVTSVVEEYYISTSPDSQAGGSWSTTVPNNADPNKYIWRRMKNTFSDGTVTYTDPALIQGMTGIYPYIGPTQPANPKEGQQWWKSDSSGNVTNFYVYKNGSWQGQTIQQSILNIVALNAVTITGSTITGTNINGSVFTNTFTIDLGVSDTGTGTTVIRDGALKMDMAVKDSAGTASYTQGQELSMQNGLYMWQKLEGQSAANQSYARLGPAGLDLQSIAGGAVRNTTLSIDNIYSLVRPAGRSVKPADDANRKSVSLSYSRVGNIVSVGINFELLSDTGWVALAPVAPSGYAPSSPYQATGVACSLSYRGYTCAVYYNSNGFRLIPTIGQGQGSYQLGLTWRTNDPFPYGDS
ncbi:phage tail spike protein [Enterococcus asini]|uniref:phage tail spike protein n=1 Tax=Enterococcus asini TaxID=57732 RepID=UPI00288F58D3|nr:phage tail spike protein [Enterococcus asini]MDT2783152.1 phage tail spike protein [Enterococcus asini]